MTAFKFAGWTNNSLQYNFPFIWCRSRRNFRSSFTSLFDSFFHDSYPKAIVECLRGRKSRQIVSYASLSFFVTRIRGWIHEQSLQFHSKGYQHLDDRSSSVFLWKNHRLSRRLSRGSESVNNWSLWELNVMKASHWRGLVGHVTERLFQMLTNVNCIANESATQNEISFEKKRQTEKERESRVVIICHESLLAI